MSPSGYRRPPLRKRATEVAFVMMGFGLLVGNARGGGLDRVMQAMESDYQALSRALFREDYVEAKKAAERLASHPTPGFAEKLTLLARLGTAAGRFQELDSQVKETARDISSAADARAFDRMATGFERLTDRCLSCHSRFGTHANLDASD